MKAELYIKERTDGRVEGWFFTTIKGNKMKFGAISEEPNKVIEIGRNTLYFIKKYGGKYITKKYGTITKWGWEKCIHDPTYDQESFKDFKVIKK